ncbi:MAG: helix-turn-helix transcriptional regulator [Bacilli bacterium]|nr:helix-turn-helix transcriptional regulator [Bacilli bacterium]
MTAISIKKDTPLKIKIAIRLRTIRRKKKVSQEQLWLLSSVSLGSIKRFERTGDISLDSLIKIATALDQLDSVEQLFKK